MIQTKSDNIENRTYNLQNMNNSPYENVSTDLNTINPYSINSNEFSSESNAYSRNPQNTSQDDMKFIPLSDYNKTNNKTTNNNATNNTQFPNEPSMNFNLEEAHKCLDLIFKSDINNMPFIPNPYYMMGMNKSNTPNPMDNTQRQYNPYHHDPDHDHDYDYDYGHNFNPQFHPYYQHYPYYPFNNYPYFYPYQYLPKNINPLALLLLSSLGR